MRIFNLQNTHSSDDIFLQQLMKNLSEDDADELYDILLGMDNRIEEIDEKNTEIESLESRIDQLEDDVGYFERRAEHFEAKNEELTLIIEQLESK